MAEENRKTSKNSSYTKELREFLAGEGFVFHDDWPMLRTEIVRRVHARHGPLHARMFQRNLGDGCSQNEGMRWDIVDGLGQFMDSLEEANLLMSVHGPHVLAGADIALEWLKNEESEFTVGEIGAWTGALGKLIQKKLPHVRYFGFEPVEHVAGLVSIGTAKLSVKPLLNEYLADQAASCDRILVCLGMHRTAVWRFDLYDEEPIHPDDFASTNTVTYATNFFRNTFEAASQIATSGARLLYLRRIRSLAELLGIVMAAMESGWELREKESGYKVVGNIGFMKLEFLKKKSLKKIQLKALARWWAGEIQAEFMSSRQHSDSALSEYLSLRGRVKTEAKLIQDEFGGFVGPAKMIEVGRCQKGHYKFNMGEGMQYELMLSSHPFELTGIESMTTQRMRESYSKKKKERTQYRHAPKRDLIHDWLDLPDVKDTASEQPLHPYLEAYLSGDDRAMRNARRRLNQAMAKKQQSFIEDIEEWAVFLEEQKSNFFRALTNNLGKKNIARKQSGGGIGRTVKGHQQARELDPEEYAIQQDAMAAADELRDTQHSSLDNEDSLPSHPAVFFRRLKIDGTNQDDLLPAIQFALTKLTEMIHGTIKGVQYHERKHKEIADLDVTRSLYRIKTLVRVEDTKKSHAVMSGARKLEFPLPAKGCDPTGLYKASIPRTLLHSQQDILYALLPRCPSLPVLEQMNGSYINASGEFDDLEWLSVLLAAKNFYYGVRRARACLHRLRKNAEAALEGSAVPEKNRLAVARFLARLEGWMIHAIIWLPTV